MLSKHIFFASAFAGLCDIVSSSPVGPGVENVLKNLKARQNSFYPITGASGGVQPRQEIRTLQSSNPDLWNLFLAATERFQATDQTKKTSYYQVSGECRVHCSVRWTASSNFSEGIHGEPLIAWDGVQGSPDVGLGYCPHSSNLFGPWHSE
jgi:tyrosinase